MTIEWQSFSRNLWGDNGLPPKTSQTSMLLVQTPSGVTEPCFPSKGGPPGEAGSPFVPDRARSKTPRSLLKAPARYAPSREDATFRKLARPARAFCGGPGEQRVANHDGRMLAEKRKPSA